MPTGERALKLACIFELHRLREVGTADVGKVEGETKAENAGYGGAWMHESGVDPE